MKAYSNVGETFDAEKTSYQIAYLVYLPAYAYIIYYALSGSKIRTNNNYFYDTNINLLNCFSADFK